MWTLVYWTLHSVWNMPLRLALEETHVWDIHFCSSVGFILTWNSARTLTAPESVLHGKGPDLGARGGTTLLIHPAHYRQAEKLA